MELLVVEAIRNAREAGETSIMIDYAADGAALQGANGHVATIGFSYDAAGNMVYDAPGKPRIHAG